MRNLTPEEIGQALEDNGEPGEGCVAIEATIDELSSLGVRTVSGDGENNPFHELAENGYGHLLCRGWYLDKDAAHEGNDRTVWGLFHVGVEEEEEAQKVSRIAIDAGGRLRFSGPSAWEGFSEFAVE